MDKSSFPAQTGYSVRGAKSTTTECPNFKKTKTVTGSGESSTGGHMAVTGRSKGRSWGGQRGCRGC
uniref:Uncharacterized protein n=1 Tax=Anguilla anguilla TaxID=7936 RepID=A0A0E9V6E9_ANGAN